jgi:hypothetical protein
LPHGSENIEDAKFPAVPTLLRELSEQDHNFFGYEPYSTVDRRTLSDNYLLPALNSFCVWAVNNPTRLSQTLE